MLSPPWLLSFSALSHTTAHTLIAWSNCKAVGVRRQTERRVHAAIASETNLSKA